MNLRFVYRIVENQGLPSLITVLQQKSEGQESGVQLLGLRRKPEPTWQDIPVEWENDNDRKHWIEICERGNMPGHMYRQFYPLHR